jgi:hypothetical protein
MERKQSTSLRLSHDAKRLLRALAQILGITQTAALEIAIRDAARRKGLK